MVNIQGPDKICIARKSEKKLRIFVDMDGVMSNWLKGCCEVCKIDSNSKEFRDATKDGIEVPDIKSNNITQAEMWDKIVQIGSSWWKELDLLPWANKLHDMISKHGEVAFLSSPGNLNKFPESVAEACKGKMEWIYKYFKDTPPILCQAKYLCASPNSILIDDSAKKVDEFIEYGGKAFLWPNQYSLMDGEIDLDETLEELELKIKSMK